MEAKNRTAELHLAPRGCFLALQTHRKPSNCQSPPVPGGDPHDAKRPFHTRLEGLCFPGTRPGWLGHSPSMKTRVVACPCHHGHANATLRAAPCPAEREVVGWVGDLARDLSFSLEGEARWQRPRPDENRKRAAASHLHQLANPETFWGSPKRLTRVPPQKAKDGERFVDLNSHLAHTLLLTLDLALFHGTSRSQPVPNLRRPSRTRQRGTSHNVSPSSSRAMFYGIRTLHASQSLMNQGPNSDISICGNGPAHREVRKTTNDNSQAVFHLSNHSEIRSDRQTGKQYTNTPTNRPIG